MAAIARSRPFAILILALAVTVSAQQSKAIHQQVARVATALSSGDAEDAMAPVAKSFDGYSRLRDYFVALTNAYSVINDLEITDEQIQNHEATLTVHWVMTLSDQQSGLSETRSEDIIVKLTMKKFDWQIVSVSPLDFFSPDPRKSK